MAKIRGHRDLIVWQKSMSLVVDVYKMSNGFPSDARFALTQQIRRAAVSIPSNIAEGHARSSTGAFQNHLSISLGSVAEVETQLELALRLEYTKQDKFKIIQDQLEEVGKMLRGLRKSLNPES